MAVKLNQSSSKSEPATGIKRFIIEQDNGKVRYLEGEAAEKYLKQIDSVLGFMQLTRSYMLPNDFLQASWKEIDVREVIKLFHQNPKTKQ